MGARRGGFSEVSSDRENKASTRRVGASASTPVSLDDAVRRQALLIDLSLEPIFTWDLDAGIIQWNRGAESVYGFSASEAIGVSSDQLLKTIYPVPPKTLIKELVASGSWAGEVRQTTKDGREVVVESRQQLIESNGRRLVLENNRDITHRKTEEQRLELLAEVGDAIRMETDAAQLLFRVASAVGKHFRANRCLFNEIDLENDVETVRAHYQDGGPPASGTHKVSSYSPLTSEEMAAGRTVINIDSKTDPRTAAYFKRTYGPAGERSYIAVPLMRDNRWVASLWLSCSSPREWSAAEVSLLELIAERSWLAVEKIRSEGEMRLSEARFSRFMSHLPGLAWIKDLSGRYVFANEAAVGAFNAPGGKLFGHTDEELFPPETAAEFRKNDERVVRTKKGHQAVESLKYDDGSLHYSIVNKFPIPGSDGRPALIGGMAIDITEQRRAEEQMRLISRMPAENPHPVLRISDDGEILYANAAAEPLLRFWKRESGLDLPRDFRIRLHEAFRVGIRQELELNFDGRTLVATIAPILEGGYVNVYGIDITDRKKAEEALREKEAELQLIADSTPVVLVRCSRDLKYQFINKAGAALFAAKPAEMVGKPIVEMMGRDAFELVKPYIDRVLAGQSVEFEIPVPYPAAGERRMRVNYLPEFDANGEVAGWIASIIDVTELRTAQQERLTAVAKFESVFNQSGVFAGILDLDGRLREVNDIALDACGYTREQVIDLPFWETAWWQGSEAIQERIRVAVERAAAGSVFREVLPFWLADGTERVVDFALHPIRGENGEVMVLYPTGVDITERRAAEESLRRSDERFRLAQEAGQVGIFDWDIIHDQTYWSEAMWTIYGLDDTGSGPNEQMWSKRLHTADRDRAVAKVRNAVESGSSHYRDEFRVVRPDGSVRWVGSTARILRDEEGRAVRMFGVDIDITERKQSEERLRLSQNQLRLITDGLPALISYVNKDERYVYANKTYSEWFGVDPKDVVGRSVRSVFGVSAYRKVKASIDNALSGRESRFEALVPYKKGGPRYVIGTYVPDIGIDGTVRGYFGLTNDLTDLKRSQELLRSSEERLGLLMETFTDYAIISLDRDGRVESWNTGAEHIFGYSRDEMMGQSCDRLFTPEDIAADAPNTEMRHARQKGRAMDERWHVRKDGSRFYASGVMMPLYMGRILTGYAKIASDLTEKKKHAEELQEARDELEVRVALRTRELAASNAALLQEIEQRTAAEKQRIDLLRRLVTSQEFERRRIARDLHDQLGQRLTALRLKIASLKEVSAGSPFADRIDRLQEIGEQLDTEVSFLAWELRPSALDDLGLIDAVGTYVTEWSRHYETPAEFHASGVANEQFDRDAETHLYRITQEALNNIAKYAEASEVSVLMEKMGDNIVLIIEDDGKGFDPSVETVPTESGHGLGLTGMRERAALIGGDFEIESAAGKGTTIFVRVPAAN